MTREDLWPRARVGKVRVTVVRTKVGRSRVRNKLMFDTFWSVSRYPVLRMEGSRGSEI